MRFSVLNTIEICNRELSSVLKINGYDDINDNVAIFDPIFEGTIGRFAKRARVLKRGKNNKYY